MTEDPIWDGVASVIIGLLLVVVAVTLAGTNLSAHRPVGGRAAAVGPATRGGSLPGVDAVHVFVAVVLGTANLPVAAKVHFATDCSAEDIERVADEAEERLRARFPGVRYVVPGPDRRGVATDERSGSGGVMAR